MEVSLMPSIGQTIRNHIPGYDQGSGAQYLNLQAIDLYATNPYNF